MKSSPNILSLESGFIKEYLYPLKNNLPFGMFSRREISSGENGDEDWPVPLLGKVNFMMFRVLTSCANLHQASAVRPAGKVLLRDK